MTIDPGIFNQYVRPASQGRASSQTQSISHPVTKTQQGPIATASRPVIDTAPSTAQAGSSLPLISIEPIQALNIESPTESSRETFSVLKKSKTIRLFKAEEKAALQEYLAQYNQYLQENPDFKSRLELMPHGQDLVHAFEASLDEEFNLNHIADIQTFLVKTMNVSLKYSGHKTGIDGRYGDRTHQELQKAFKLLAQQPAAPITPLQPIVPESATHTLQEIQEIASNVKDKGRRGLELNEQTSPIYPIFDLVKSNTSEISSSQDTIQVRSHSMRPRIGDGYILQNGKVLNQLTLQPAQVAAAVFDRTHNVMVTLDSQGNPIMALETRNNTRRHWQNKSQEWLMDRSMTSGSNAPAPNGIYAIGANYASNSQEGKTFGSRKIGIKGGTITRREIIIHSRDKFEDKEIPWNLDRNHLFSRTAGCLLLQDPDVKLLSDMFKQTDSPIAMVVQGSYTKNITSPQL